MVSRVERDGLPYVHFSVRDTGMGMSQDEVEKLFHLGDGLETGDRTVLLPDHGWRPIGGKCTRHGYNLRSKAPCVSARGTARRCTVTRSHAPADLGQRVRHKPWASADQFAQRVHECVNITVIVVNMRGNAQDVVAQLTITLSALETLLGVRRPALRCNRPVMCGARA